MSGLEADPVRDERMRYVASGIAQAIFDRFSFGKGAFDMIQAIKANGFYQTSMDITAPEDISDLGLPQKLHFDVAFLPQQEGRIAGFGVRDGKDFLIFWALPPGAHMHAAQEPELLWQYILRAMDSAGGVVIHEIIHMLDSQRGTSMEHKTASYGKERPTRFWTQEQRKEWTRRYVNSPEEFNAMFQQGMFDLRDYIEQANRGDVAWIMRSLKNFSKTADKMIGIGLLREGGIEGKFKRKLEVRLWQTYEYWKKQMAEES